jgi:hypothetical protein
MGLRPQSPGRQSAVRQLEGLLHPVRVRWGASSICEAVQLVYLQPASMFSPRPVESDKRVFHFAGT